MIDKIKEIQDILISRFNNTIISSLFLSFLMMNSRGILIFTLSNKETKIEILKNWQPDLFWDCFMPLVISAIYIMAIPLASATLKKHVTNRIYKLEQDAERDKTLISLNGMQDIEIAKVKSTAEYAEKYAHNEIQNWINEKDETISNLKKAQELNATLTKKNTELTDEVNKLSANSNYYSMLYERSINTMSLIDGALQNINKKYPTAFNSDIKFTSTDTSDKNSIITLLANAIKNILEMNNKKPASILGDWQPPINENLIDALTLLLENIKNDENKLQNDKKKLKDIVLTSSRTVEMKNSDGL
ncbi:hypothetical protein ACEUC2_07000 [Aeromonas veronii]